MRARFSDLQNLTDLKADEGDANGLPIGYVEGQVGRSKTSYTTERKTMYLPMTSPRCGLTGKDWFKSWQLARLQAAVPRGDGIPTFPALTNQGWARVPITAGAAADWLRRSLLRFILICHCTTLAPILPRLQHCHGRPSMEHPWIYVSFWDIIQLVDLYWCIQGMLYQNLFEH